MWTEKQGWIHLSNADRRHNDTKSSSESLHYANRGRPIPHVALGKPPTPAAVYSPTPTQTLRACNCIVSVAFVVDRCIIRSPFKDGLAAQLWEVQSADGFQLLRGLPQLQSTAFPQNDALPGASHIWWLSEAGGIKAWSFLSDVRYTDGNYSLWSSLAGWPRFVRPLS